MADSDVWYGLLWEAIGPISLWVVVAFAILVADAVWIIYRIVKGWLRLSESKGMYTGA